jgi:sugar phosphate isomerase/epimerase
MLCSLATKLGDKDLAEIGALEEELGVTMLAFSCHPVDPAEIDDRQLASIKALEEKLGISLVAVIQ